MNDATLKQRIFHRFGKHIYRVYKREIQHCTLCQIELHEAFNFHPIAYGQCIMCEKKTYWWEHWITVNSIEEGMKTLRDIELHSMHAEKIVGRGSVEEKKETSES